MFNEIEIKKKGIFGYYYHYSYVLGWKLIPIAPGKKIPLLPKWQKEDKSQQTLQALYKIPNCGIGIVLGEYIDIEGDTPEANKVVMNLLKDIPHPMFISGKSIHHLFRNPGMDIRIIKNRGIEVRGKGHFTILPPSNNDLYRWIVPPNNIPELPGFLIRFFNELAPKRKIFKQNFCESICSSCGNKQIIHEQRLAKEINAFKTLGKKWACRYCRTLDVRPLCKKLKGQK
jgi:hypothetical protein